MSRSTRTTTIVTLLALLCLPVAVTAQNSAGESTEPATRSEKYQAGLARMSSEFWTTRMNAYKVEIDRMLSASDLVSLNELRTRAGILMEEMAKLAQKLEEKRRENGSADSMTYARMAAASDSMAYARMASMSDSIDQARMAATSSDVEASISSDTAGMMEDAGAYSEAGYYEGEDDSREEYLREIRIGNRENVALLDRAFAGDDSVLAALIEERNGEKHRRYFTSDEDYAKQIEFGAEYSRLGSVCGWIARNYRPGMDALLVRYAADFEEFYTAVVAHARAFMHETGPAGFEDRELVTMMTTTLHGLGQYIEILDPAATAGAYFRPMMEANIMLHNGRDLYSIMMTDNGPVASAASKSEPEGNSLGQNSPNPASSRTTIPYTLAEAAQKVTIQLLDTRGTIVATYEQGAREGGEHSASIDVSALTPGTYLYQLTVTTAGGARVFSKGMQVVR